MSYTEEPNESNPRAEIFKRERHSITPEMIDPEARRVLTRLNQSGFKAYVVGGGVRDLLLGKEPKDFDIATDATPREIKSLFRNSRVIGKRYKLVQIFFPNGKIFEVSTFRDLGAPADPDANTDGTTPIVTRENTYGTESSDALRRDLTINGLFYDLHSNSIIDYVGGVRDLSNRLIRIIGDPDTRFLEDPVRMIRVARHAARNNFEIEDSCKESINNNYLLITRASPVRVFDELKKDLTSGHSLPTLRLMAELKLLDPLLPEILQKDSLLLSDVSELSHCLARADDLAKDGLILTSASVLALCALFVHGLNSMRKDIYSWFSRRREILELSDNCFKSMAVPKRERERIANILTVWHNLGVPPFNREAIQSAKKSSSRLDLALLLKYLSDDEDVERFANTLLNMPPPPRPDRQRRRPNRSEQNSRDGRRERPSRSANQRNSQGN